MDIREVLVETKNKLEKGWCQGLFNRDEFGNNADASKLESASWCLFGAIRASAGEKQFDAEYGQQGNTLPVIALVQEMIKTTLPVGEQTSLVNWNDDQHRTQSQVVSVVKAAIMTYDLRERRKNR